MRLNFATTPRQKIITIISLTLVLTGLMLGFVGWPSVKTIMNLSDQIYEQRTELEQLYQRGQVLKQTLREYEEIKPSIPALNKIYLTRGNELEFITTMEETAAVSNMTHDIKLGAVDPKKPTNILQYQLQTTGNLTGLIKYLAALEALDFYVNINTIRISTQLSQDARSINDGFSKGLQAIILATSYFKQ